MSLVFTFPGGKKVIKTIAATAGNVVTNLSPGAGKRWLILRGYITLTCDATVADRYIFIEVTNGTVVTDHYHRTDAITGSTTGSLGFHETLFLDAAIKVDTYYFGIRPILIEGADQLRMRIANGVAGDSYEGFVTVLELSV